MPPTVPMSKFGRGQRHAAGCRIGQKVQKMVENGYKFQDSLFWAIRYLRRQNSVEFCLRRVWDTEKRLPSRFFASNLYYIEKNELKI